MNDNGDWQQGGEGDFAAKSESLFEHGFLGEKSGLV
jgi:hypothetical protein